jgi:hypothetical protein
MHGVCKTADMDEPSETPTELRQRAARIRRHALALRFDESAPRLLALARELDARADAMESSAD